MARVQKFEANLDNIARLLSGQGSGGGEAESLKMKPLL
jgi:hypothetical protein